jgi:hypothetical protein
VWDIIVTVTTPPSPYESEYRPPSQPQYPQSPGGQYPPPYQGQPAPYQGGPPGGYGVDQYGRPLSDKDKLTAGLLGIFLGNFGVGRFYLGYTTIGVLQLLFSWLTCGLWGLIDGILIIAGKVPDSEGRTLRE